MTGGALVAQADALRACSHALSPGKMVPRKRPGGALTPRAMADQHLGRVTGMAKPTHTAEQRLWAKIDRAETGCWSWLASRSSEGYGKVRQGGRDLLVHRVVYELLVGPIPAGLTLDHLCRNRACCRPDHLEPVPMAENIARGESPSAVNGRKVVCKVGHPLSGSNLYVRPNGQRCCKECRRQRTQRYRDRDNPLRGEGPTKLNATKTHCVNGHPFDAANTYWRPTGGRACRRCGADETARRRRKRP